MDTATATPSNALRLLAYAPDPSEIQPGDVLHWRGPRDSHRVCVVRIDDDPRFGRTVVAYHLDVCGNSHLAHIRPAQIVHADASTPHTQYYYTTPERRGADDVRAMLADHAAQAAAKSARDAEAAQRRRDMIASGRRIWHALALGGGRRWAIVAERIRDDSDPQSDYFGESVVETIYLAISSHGRDLFPELRRAASTLPETAHLGPGKTYARPRVVHAHDSLNPHGYAGQYSPHHRRLEERDGAPLAFGTSAEAQAYADAHPVDPPAIGDAHYCWRIDEQRIEHREKYSMGRGYYLQAPGSPWRVSKTAATDDAGRPTDDILLALHNRHVHDTTRRGQTPEEFLRDCERRAAAATSD